MFRAEVDPYEGESVEMAHLLVAANSAKDEIRETLPGLIKLLGDKKRAKPTLQKMEKTFEHYFDVSGKLQQLHERIAATPDIQFASFLDEKSTELNDAVNEYFDWIEKFRKIAGPVIKKRKKRITRKRKTSTKRRRTTRKRK